VLAFCCHWATARDAHGLVRKRADDHGRHRYQACDRDAQGRVRTAGTHATKREAERAWLQVELLLSQGRLGAADLGKLTFTRYVNEVWFPNHVLEPSTREGYRYSINKHLMPTFGPMRMSRAVEPSSPPIA